MKKVKYFFFLLSFIIQGQEIPDNFRFKNLSIEDGLSQNDVDYITQDSTGYIWIAAANGINRYNGQSFRHYPKMLRSSTDYTLIDQKLYYDSNDRLWLLNGDGALSIYNSDLDDFIPLKKIKNPKCIVEDKNGDLYIGTVNKGLFKIDKNDTIQILNKTYEDIKFHQITQLNNDLYASTYNKVLKIDRKGKTKEVLNIANVDSMYTAIASSSKRSVWLGTKNFGLLRLNGDSGKFERFNGFRDYHIPNNLYVVYLYFDTKGRLWVATYGDGVYLINFEELTIKHFRNISTNSSSLASNVVRSIYEDNNHRIWIATTNGISFYDEYLFKFNKLTSQDLPKGQEIGTIRSIAKDKNDNIWIGTLLSGVYKLNFRSRVLKQYTPQNSGLLSKKSFKVRYIDNKIWILNIEGQIQTLDENDNFKTLPVNFSDNSITDFKVDSKGNIWLLDKVNGLLLYDNVKDKIIPFWKDHRAMVNFTPKSIFCLSEDSNGILWIGTLNNGLIRLNPITKEVFHYKNVLVNDVITEIYSDENNTLWLGTGSSGLVHFDPKSEDLVYYNQENGLAANTIFSILPDDKDLWMGSSNGLIKFNIENGASQNFDTSTGLQSLEFNTRASYKDPKNGLMIFGGQDGINWFFPKNIKTNPFPPETVISKIKMFSNDHPLIDNQEFKYNENTLTFTFHGLHFSAPNENKYRYRLLDYEEQWIENKTNNFVRYPNLPPGDYTLQVLSSNNDGLWDQTPAQYKFSILKPWYGTDLAKAIYLLFLLLIIYTIYMYFKNRWHLKTQLEIEHQEAERLKELDELKNRLYINISHELRTPLTLISGPAERQLKNSKISNEERNDLNLINRSAKRLLNLVDQLLDLSKLQSGNLQIAVSEINLNQFLKQLITPFSFKANEKEIDFTYETANLDKGWIDPEILNKIVTNLLSNAVKYTPNKGIIKFMAENKEQHLILNVFNNGVSLTKNDIPRLFERYYQTDRSHTGAGIGLSLVKELALVAHGSVIANLIGNDEIQFTVSLPITRSAYRADEIIDDLQVSKPEASVHINRKRVNTTSTTRAPLLLIVEDDKDIRTFMCSLFKSKYKIQEAINGEQGFEMALKFIPDIIISDVMMPKKDGVEMVNELKNNELTSHIPILLLTAKSGSENEIYGLKSGADDYITKPFNVEKLQLKVKNLLKLRENLQKKYAHSFQLNDLPATNLEVQFLKRLHSTLTDHITDPDLTAHALANKMAMSRTQLHRKLKAICNKSTTQFIREQRLELAVKLLRNSDDSISEIAYKTGFNSISYFNRIFKKTFNESPTTFRN